MKHPYRTRWSGQGCMNKLIIISIVMYILKQSEIIGGGHVWDLKQIYSKQLVYGTGCRVGCVNFGFL